MSKQLIILMTLDYMAFENVQKAKMTPKPIKSSKKKAKKVKLR